MASWNVQDGLFHFLFANEDRYVLDSMVCLNLTDYLRHELSGRHMEKILFIEGVQDSFVVRVFRPEVWQWCADKIRGIFGMGFKGGQAYQADPSGCRILCTAEQIRKLPAQAEKTAFVFALETFAAVYRAREGEVSQLKQENAVRKNLVILRAGVMSEESQPLLTDPGGIFQGKGTGGALFPEIIEAFADADPADEGCYTLLARKLGERCIFLNRMTHDAVRRLVRRTVWIERNNADALTEKITEYIWRWHHDAALQLEKSGLFSENPSNSYAVLGRDISRFWKLIREAAEAFTFDEPITYPVGEMCVISTPMAVRALPETKYMWQDDPSRHRAYHAVNTRIRRTLQKPRVVSPSGKAEWYLKRFIDRLNIAMKKGDTETIGRIEACINDVVRRKFAYNDDEKMYWEYHDNLIAESGRLFEAEQNIRMDEYRLKQLKSQKDASNEQVKNPYLGDAERGYWQGRVVSISREMKTYEDLIDRRRLDMLDIRDRIAQIEQAEELLRHQITLEETKRAEDLLRELSRRIEATAVQPDPDVSDAEPAEVQIPPLEESWIGKSESTGESAEKARQSMKDLMDEIF